MSLFAASLESLIVFVVILLLSAVGNWLKTRKGQDAESLGDETGPAAPPRRPGQPSPAPRQPSAPPAPLFDLERELRRMLGQEPEPPPPTPPAPPPVLNPEPVRESPAPPTRRWPATAEREEEFVPVPLPPATHFPRSAPALDQVGAPSFELAGLEPSRTAYEQASPQGTAVRARFDAFSPDAPHAPGAARFVRHRTASPELSSVLRSLSNPRTARQAILASVILGAPRGLDR